MFTHRQECLESSFHQDSDNVCNHQLQTSPLPLTILEAGTVGVALGQIFNP
jgi:hypothetical protein